MREHNRGLALSFVTSYEAPRPIPVFKVPCLFPSFSPQSLEWTKSTLQTPLLSNNEGSCQSFHPRSFRGFGCPCMENSGWGPIKSCTWFCSSCWANIWCAQEFLSALCSGMLSSLRTMQYQRLNPRLPACRACSYPLSELCILLFSPCLFSYSEVFFLSRSFNEAECRFGRGRSRIFLMAVDARAVSWRWASQKSWPNQPV